MNSAGGENPSNSIENLKSFALSTHKELKSLHSRNLFKNFSSGQFEILLDDLKNGQYDENKFGIQKRVEWHILNSINSTEYEQQNNDLKNSGINNEVRKINYRSANLSLIPAVRKNFPSTPSQASKYGEVFKKYQDKKKEWEKLCKSKKEQESFNIQNQSQFVEHDSYSVKNSMCFGHRCISYKSVNLERISVPQINILPLSKEALPHVNIEPSISEELPRKSIPISQLLRKKVSNKLSNLEKIKNVSVDIPPLDKQSQPNINVLPCRKRIHNIPNQAVYEYKHEETSSDEELKSVVAGESHTKTNSNLKGKVLNTKEVNPAVSIIIDNDHYTNTPSHKVGNCDTDRFYGNRFIERLEERLKSVFPPPSKKTVASNQSDQSVQVEVIKLHNKVTCLSEDCSTEKQNIPPPPVLAKSSSETQTPNVFKIDKFVQASLDQDYNKKTSGSSSYREENVKDDQNISENQELYQKPDEELSKSNGNSKRVAFELDQLSPSENKMEKDEDEDVGEDPKELSTSNLTSSSTINSRYSSSTTTISSFSSSTTTTTTTNNNNNNNNNNNINNNNEDLKNEAVLHNNQPPDSKSITNNEKIYPYDKKLQQGENSSKPYVNDTSIKNIKTKPHMYIQDNVLEQETLQHSKGLPNESKEEQSLYSQSFNSDSAEKQLLNQNFYVPERISDEEHQISSPSNTNKTHENTTGEDSFLVSKENGNSELESQEETVLPSIEIGDVTISEGEIEFEASIADAQPCNRIAIKISTKDLELRASLAQKIKGMTTNVNDFSPELANKETQTSLTHIVDTLDLEPTICDFSFSEGFILKSESKNHTTKNGLSTSSEPNDEAAENVSEGELIGKVTPILNDKEKEILLIENEKLLKRLSGIKGRFVCR